MNGQSLRGILILGAGLFMPFSRASESGSASDVPAPRAEELQQPAGKQWPVAGGDWYNTRYSTLDQINTTTVPDVGATWVFRFDEGGTSRATPVVRDGLLFITAGRKVYALDPKSGSRVWSYATVADVHQPGSGMESTPNDKGVGVGGGLVFVGLRDGHVVALDEMSGALRWIRQTGTDQPKKGQTAAVAPLYVNGNLLSGLSNGDTYLRGRLTELDAETGVERWRLDPIPGPGEAGHETWPTFNDAWKLGGAGIWSNLAVAPELGLVYATTGNAVPMFAGDWRPGDNLYTCSVLAVDMRTGKLKWYYQLVHHDVFDGDIGTPVILYERQVDGKTHEALAALRADGTLFQFDRETGVPLLPIEERPVPRLESQKSSPTQPFPVGSESILLSCEDWKKEYIPAGFVLGCMWTAPAAATDPQNVLAPFPSVRVTPMAYSPQTGYFYAQGTSMLGWPRRAPDPFFFNFGGAVPGLKAYKELAAIDARTGRIAWRRRIPASVVGGLPIHLSGGPVVTAGGLLMQSLGDGNVAAFDARTGAVRWQFQTGVGGVGGAPASYEVDGEQYVAVPIGPTVWAFKVGGKIPARAGPKSPPEDDFPGPIVESGEVETTSLQTSAYSSGSRYFVDEYAFHPYRARVSVGAKVLFVNNGDVRHEVIAVDGSWGTGPLSPTQEGMVTFSKPGRYVYICKDHPWVYGQIIVEAASAPSSSRRDAARSAARDATVGFWEQASRGQEAFDSYCAACHGEDLNGRVTAPPLHGTQFLLHWQAAAVGDLFDRIRTTMPQASPGSLDRNTYLNIVAYLLRANDLDASGSRLDDEPGALRKMRMRSARAAGSR